MNKGTYISTQLSDFSYDLLLKPQLKGCGIEGLIEPSKLHATLLYAEDAYIPPSSSLNDKYAARIVDAQILGEGDWQGLVLTLSSTAMTNYFRDIIEKSGSIHKYGNELNAHVTLKYKPVEGDLEKLKKAIKMKQVLIFEGTKIEGLEDS